MGHHNSDYPSPLSYLTKDQAERYYQEGFDFFKWVIIPDPSLHLTRHLPLNRITLMRGMTVDVVLVETQTGCQSSCLV